MHSAEHLFVKILNSTVGSPLAQGIYRVDPSAEWTHFRSKTTSLLDDIVKFRVVRLLPPASNAADVSRDVAAIMSEWLEVREWQAVIRTLTAGSGGSASGGSPSRSYMPSWQILAEVEVMGATNPYVPASYNLISNSQTMLASMCHRRHNDVDDRTLPVAQVPSCNREESLGPFDESDLDPKDVETVMLQATCSRAKAVKALRDTGADLIEAIIIAVDR